MLADNQLQQLQQSRLRLLIAFGLKAVVRKQPQRSLSQKDNQRLRIIPCLQASENSKKFT